MNCCPLKSNFALSFATWTASVGIWIFARSVVFTLKSKGGFMLTSLSPEILERSIGGLILANSAASNFTSLASLSAGATGSLSRPDGLVNTSGPVGLTSILVITLGSIFVITLGSMVID